MTNNQILEKFNEGSGSGIDNWYCYDDIITVMNMLREELSNTEQPQGVDVWVSVDEDGTTKLSESELEFFEREKWGMFKYPERGFCVALPHQFGEFLKVEEGECAKFKIVRQP